MTNDIKLSWFEKNGNNTKKLRSIQRRYRRQAKELAGILVNFSKYHIYINDEALTEIFNKLHTKTRQLRLIDWYIDRVGDEFRRLYADTEYSCIEKQVEFGIKHYREFGYVLSTTYHFKL